MAGKKKTDIGGVREKIVLAALDLAAQKGWNKVTLPDIARKAKIKLADLHDIFEDKVDILAAFGRMIDRQVLENASDEGSPRDRLFDLLMDRFEALNEYRGGVVSILESFKCDPKQMVIGAPHLCRSMGWMLEAAVESTTGLKGVLKVAGLTALYLKAAHVWSKDESDDLAKTMASLDRDLSRLEGLAERFKF